jgi:ribosomal-protein-alanine N-acetyltransferase
MKLRIADHGDALALAKVHAEAFDPSWPPEAFTELLDSPGVFALAAAEGELAALILMRAAAGEAEVLTLAVAPAHHRKGVGLALLIAGLELAEGMGAETAFLEVADDNAAALGLYRKAGFDAVGRRSAYYRRGDGATADALVLRRTLNSPTA